MPRQKRIQFEGACYHVMARGNRLGKIFVDDEDRRMWIATLAKLCEKCDFEIFAWVLMGNHYHIVLRTPKGNLVDGMKWFQNTYTRRFNTRHREWGRVFGDRYKSILVDPQGGTYLSTLIDYVHLH